jgi:hypothetical protein
MMRPADAERLTGYHVGGISPKCSLIQMNKAGLAFADAISFLELAADSNDPARDEFACPFSFADLPQLRSGWRFPWDETPETGGLRPVPCWLRSCVLPEIAPLAFTQAAAPGGGSKAFHGLLLLSCCACAGFVRFAPRLRESAARFRRDGRSARDGWPSLRWSWRPSAWP